MKTDPLQDLLELAELQNQILCEIRFCEWPTIGLGIGLQASKLDEVVVPAIRIISRAKAALRYKQEVRQRALAKLTLEEREVLGF